MLPKHECSALESALASMGLEGPGELHFEMQQTAVDSTRSSKQRGAFYLEEYIGVKPEISTKVTSCQELARLPISRQQRE